MISLEEEARLMLDLADHVRDCPKDGAGIILREFQEELGGFPGFRYEECECGGTTTAGCADCDGCLIMVSRTGGWCWHARAAIAAGLMPESP